MVGDRTPVRLSRRIDRRVRGQPDLFKPVAFRSVRPARTTPPVTREIDQDPVAGLGAKGQSVQGLENIGTGSAARSRRIRNGRDRGLAEPGRPKRAADARNIARWRRETVVAGQSRILADPDQQGAAFRPERARRRPGDERQNDRERARLASWCHRRSDWLRRRDCGPRPGSRRARAPSRCTA